MAYSNRKEAQRVFRDIGGVTSKFGIFDDIQDLVSREIIQLPLEKKNTNVSSMYKENESKIIIILNYQDHIRLICSSCLLFRYHISIRSVSNEYLREDIRM